MKSSPLALIIDDDEDIRDLLRAMLEENGIEVDALTDGIEALHLTRPYDIILLDLKMPVFDGQRLTDYWQLTDPDILSRVIVLSGFARLQFDREPETFARLQKPFDYATLMNVVNECIRNRRPAAAGEAHA